MVDTRTDQDGAIFLFETGVNVSSGTKAFLWSLCTVFPLGQQNQPPQRSEICWQTPSLGIIEPRSLRRH
jgi:hypothetical protein